MKIFITWETKYSILFNVHNNIVLCVKKEDKHKHCNKFYIRSAMILCKLQQAPV